MVETSLPWLRDAEREPFHIEHGDVWWGKDACKRHVCDGSGVMALACDDSGVVLKAGGVSAVREAVQRHETKLRDAGFGEMASSVVTFEFPPCPETVALLNWTLSRSGSASRFAENLQATETMMAQTGTAPPRLVAPD